LEGLLLPLQKKHKATITQRVVVALAKEARVPWKGCFFKEGLCEAQGRASAPEG